MAIFRMFDSLGIDTCPAFAMCALDKMGLARRFLVLRSPTITIPGRTNSPFLFPCV